MTTELEKVEQDNIVELADKYRQQGYQVFVKLGGKKLHEFISNDELDLIIHTEKEGVVVAVKPHYSQSQSESLPEQDATKSSLQTPRLYDYPCHDLYDIHLYLARALEIIEMNAYDSAVCSTARTAEAVMRLVAEHHSIDFEPQSPAELAQTFLERDLITQEDYEVLVTALDLRDAIMYKREEVTVDPKFAYQTVEVVQRLLSQAGQVEDEMVENC